MSNNPTIVSQSRLGKGLEALIPRTYFASGKMVTNIPISEIKPNPFQPRKEFNEESIQEMVDSIKTFGVLQPIIVRKKGESYELVAGERRFRSAQLAELVTIPAIIKDLNDQDSLQIALIENVLREDLNIIEKAEGFKNLLHNHQFTHDEIAKVFGKNRSTISNTLRLLTLPEIIKNDLKKGEITEGHARTLINLENEEQILSCYKLIKDQELNVRQAEKLAKKNKDKITEKIKPEKVYNAELALKQRFGDNIIVNGSNNRGKIEIKYNNTAELEGLCCLLLRE